MKKKLLQLVINTQAAMRQLRHTMGAGGGLDSKRPRAWCEYGFAETLTPSDFYNAYDRDGLANAAIELRADTVWSEHPRVAEGLHSSDVLDQATDEEKQLAACFATAGAWEALKMADLMRMVAGYSYLILELKDGQKADRQTTANSLAAVQKVVAAWPTQVTENRAATGEIQSYSYNEPQPDGSLRQRLIHPSRVVEVGCKRNGRSMLRAGFNSLVTLEKIMGGAGESFLKNAARQLNLNFDSDVDLKDLAEAYGVDLEDFQEKLNDTAADINSGLDLLLMTQGAQANTLTVAVSDPGPSFNVAIMVFAASVKTPVKILVGNITGERASTEDWKQYKAICQAWRKNEATQATRALIDKLVSLEMLSFTDYTVVWGDLTAGTLSEKADTLTKLLAMVQTYAAASQASYLTGEEPLITRDELRDKLGFDNE